MKRHQGWSWAAAAFLCLPVACNAAAAPPPARESVLQEDAWHRTRTGIAYITPAGWTAHARGASMVMSQPEDQASMAIVDVDAATPEQALDLAWKQYLPDFAPTPRASRDRPPRNGWSSVRTYDYEAGGGKDHILRAQLFHEGDTWIVAIMDLPAQAMDRREAQVTRVLSSIRARDYVPETLADRPARDLDASRIAELVAFLDEARAGLAIPGLALGVVQHGRVKYAGGLGVRRLGHNEPVDASTRFLTASVTKQLTSLMLAKLVDQGRLDWDTPAVRVLPSFRVGDAALTPRIRVRHMVCACTGIPAQDMEWVFSGDEMDPDDVLDVLGRIRPTARLGELYQYSNLMAAAGGYLGGHVAHPGLPLDAAYDRAMQELVFDPLGMASTTFDFAAAQRGNFASPHGTTIEGDTVPAPMGYNLMSLPMRPDGGAWSSVNDLVRYLQMELSSGRLPDGRRYIGEAALHARIQGQVARGGIDQWYGMGLRTDRRLGILQVMHGGSMAGYQAEVFWLPDSNAGYVLLMNADAGMQLRTVFYERFLEVLFGVDRNATATLRALPDRLKQAREAHRGEIRVPVEASVLAQLAPGYAHPALGTIRVERAGMDTWFDFGGWRTQVAEVASEGGTALESISAGVAGLKFALSKVDGARALVLDDGQRTYTFIEADPIRAPSR